MKDNKLIAEFMGWTFHGFSYSTPFIKLIRDNEETNQFPPIELKFHTSWDWLMPVVEKISKIPNKHIDGMYAYLVHIELNPITGVVIEGMYSRNFDDKDDFQKEIYYQHNFITNTYQAVVEFIKWYNDSK